MYFGYCYWGGDCILRMKQVVDSGPGSPSDLVLLSWAIVVVVVSWEIAAFAGGSGLLIAVAGGVGQFHKYSCRVKTYFG